MSSETAPLPPEAVHAPPEPSAASHTFPPPPQDSSDGQHTPANEAPQVVVVDLTPAMQMRLSLLRRLWLASVEMRKCLLSHRLIVRKWRGAADRLTRRNELPH